MLLMPVVWAWVALLVSVAIATALKRAGVGTRATAAAGIATASAVSPAVRATPTCVVPLLLLWCALIAVAATALRLASSRALEAHRLHASNRDTHRGAC